MPVNGKGKPAGGYRAGKKGSYGCTGFPTVSADGTVHGCHPTKAKAAAQARAIWASTTAKKFVDTISKSMVTEGDFVMYMGEDEEIMVGRVEYVMTNPGLLGLPGSEYALEYAEDDKPIIVRKYEEEDGAWEEEPYVCYHRMSEVIKIESLSVSVDLIVEMGSSDSGIPEYTPEVAEAMYDAQVGKSEDVDKRDPSTATRERMAAEGTAMPDGSFPIANATDLRNAIQSVGRAKDYNAAKQHIISRARALGMINSLPEDWKNTAKKDITGWGGTIFDLNPFVK